MTVFPFEKIQHTALPECEKQAHYYLTELLSQINLIRGNLSSYKSIIGNHKNQIEKCEHQMVKLNNTLDRYTEEYKKVQAMTFTVEQEIAAETKVVPKDDPKPEPEQKPEPEKNEKLDELLEEKGLTREKLLELLQG